MSKTLPYTTIAAKSSAPVFCFCDHASHYVPASYNNLGLKPADLQRHIGWDIGAQTLTQLLCQSFGAAGLLAGFSRLLIDPNRHSTSSGLIPTASDGTPIPANQNLSAGERQQRMDHYYTPYHRALGRALDETQTRHVDPLIISIHSFTPEPARGEKRKLDIGILWKVDEEGAQKTKQVIESVHPYRVGLNVPYSALKLNHTMDEHVIGRGLRHITLEVRQDLIDTQAGAQKLALHLSKALRNFIGS